MNYDDKLSRLLKLLDEKTLGCPKSYERALYVLLDEFRDSLPPLDDRFHKSFRQTDCILEHNGRIDAAIWLLLDSSDVFWECLSKVNSKDEVLNNE